MTDTSNMTIAELEAAQKQVMIDFAQKMAEAAAIVNGAIFLFRNGLPDSPVPLASTLSACKAYVGKINSMNAEGE